MMRFGVAKKSFFNNPWCGDAAFTYQDGERAIMAVVDGLGHSKEAARAAKVAVACLGGCTGRPLKEMLLSVEKALSSTIGGVLTIALLHKERAVLEACGVGNVELQLATPARVFRFVGEPGIAGEKQTRFRPLSFPYRPGDIVVIYSDGIRNAFSARNLIHILHPDPDRIARRILNEHARLNDDALVLVGCER